MNTATILTLHLAILIGLYESAAGIAGLTGRLRWTELLDEFDRSRGLSFVTGFVAFAIGGTMVLVHDIWTDPLAVIVSLIGWAALIEGLVFLILPEALLSVSRPLVRFQRSTSLAALLFGAFLLTAGLTGTATPTL